MDCIEQLPSQRHEPQLSTLATPLVTPLLSRPRPHAGCCPLISSAPW